MPNLPDHDPNPALRLGKAAAKRDPRNFKFAALLKTAAPAVPREYDFDKSHPGIPLPMFANDRFGDCVLAGRAHQTLRFELLEQKKLIPITDQEVINEYLKQTGGEDTGLYVLDSLGLWRKVGWRAARKLYKIKAFAEINRKDPAEVRRAIYADVGVTLGLNLPISAQKQFQDNKPWTVTRGSGAVPGGWGGHAVGCFAYTPSGPVCVTWGKKQPMSWGFFQKYCDEAFACFDAANTFKQKLIDVTKLDSMLEALA